jgi:catechol 2,3-dioxygenase-like lactoylglutathione lyase family enzyme
MKHEFEINGLDHVAIRVKDLERSADWYMRVLGLRRYQTKEWGPYPVFLLANRSGIALFPANLDDPVIDPTSRNVKLDHFAFNVSRENFEKARKYYEEHNIKYSFSDHHYFHSIYTKDPDGHTVELTTIVVNEKDFYRL